jgi:signal transduction histidine kinase
MKLDTPVPMERLIFFKNKLGLDNKDFEVLAPYRAIFQNKRMEFAEYFHHFFMEIPDTRLILEYERHQDRLLKMIWPNWFGLLFTKEFNDTLISYLWKSGLVHVEEKIDQRFINLGYSIIQQFCHKIAMDNIPPTNLARVLKTIDKMVDFCLLIETQAYVTATVRCDIEVVKGLSHQVRNPITVIGGNISRLAKDLPPDSPHHEVYKSILSECRRLEKMLADTGVYSEMFHDEHGLKDIDLEVLITRVLEKVKKIGSPLNLKLEIALDGPFRCVRGNEKEYEIMFYNILQNCIEALSPQNPYIRISSKRPSPDSPFIHVEIFNTGIPINEKDIDNLFVPFFSSKPEGTGFGLPTALLVAKKNLGDLFLEPVPGKGTRCVITLPVSKNEKERG